MTVTEANNTNGKNNGDVSIIMDHSPRFAGVRITNDEEAGDSVLQYDSDKEDYHPEISATK